MTIQTEFFNWGTSGLNYLRPPYESCSPNLQALEAFIVGEYGGYSLGCHGNRNVREGTTISTHAFGAAWDWRYTPVPVNTHNVPRSVVEQEVLPFIIAHSRELHVDAIHDYYGDRIWRAGRTSDEEDAYGLWWRKQHGAGAGMGASWATYLHFETHKDGFMDATPIGRRLTVDPPPDQPDTSTWPTPPGTPQITRGATDASTVMAGWPSGRVTYLQSIMGTPWPTTGMWDAASQAELKRLQRIGGITTDGIYGPKSAQMFRAWRGR